uniref:Galactose mutarotase n=1 Tax=Steinernema glaseri TaxID=37863 RepID=A0A1I7YXX2_9BILA
MRSVTVEAFGQSRREEKRIVLVTLTSNRGVRLELLNFGAAIKSLRVPDRDGALTDVVKGFDTFEEYERDATCCGCTVGRVAGEIGFGQFALDSREYLLGVNAPPHHRNGGARSCLSKKVWNYELLEEGNAVCFSCRSHDGEGGYPGTLTVEVTYILTNQNEVVVDYRASSDKATILNLSSNLLFHLGAKSLEHLSVQLSNNRFLPTDEDGLVTGEIIPTAGTLLDCSSGPRPLRSLLGTQPLGVYFAQDLSPDARLKKFRHVARVSNAATGVVLNVASTYPTVFLSSLEEHLLLRCQHFPDAINKPSFPSVVLRKDQIYQQMTSFRFGICE